jgi:adenylate cyclase
VQGYLANTERASIRVRVSGATASLNIKSTTLGAVRSEFDFPIPATDGRILLDTLCMRPQKAPAIFRGRPGSAKT